MSKSLGNSPEPLLLMDHYGADGVRVGMLFSSPAGNDLLFDESLCEQGRNFCNKIWNAFRLTQGWRVEKAFPQPEEAKVAVDWFRSNLNQSLEIIADHFSKYRMADALLAVYKLIWDDFCSWYLEMVKPAYGKSLDQSTYTATISFLDSLLRLLHPFMPFITEEIYQRIRKETTRKASPSPLSPNGKFDEGDHDRFAGPGRRSWPSGTSGRKKTSPPNSP
jgi:valyl-tRNA synthetase